MKRYYIFLILSVLAVFISIIGGCGDTVSVPTESPTPSQQQQIVNISAIEAFDLIQENISNPDFIIIDVRTPAEYDEGHIENAELVDYNAANFREEIGKYDRDKKYLIYCRTGRRSAGARDIMEELGFQYIYHMEGGITEWMAEGLPVVK